MQIAGTAVKARRLALGLTQEAAARRAAVSIDTWRRAEKYERCSDLTLASMARALELEPGMLKSDRPTEEARVEIMCRWCAQPVSGTGIRLTLVNRRGNRLKVRRVSDDSQAWLVASHAGNYCSLECLTRQAAENLYRFTSEMPGPVLDLRPRAGA